MISKVTLVTLFPCFYTEICSVKNTHMALLGFSIVLLHLIIGFGFLIYKLSPRKKTVKIEVPEPEKNKTLNIK